MGLYSFGQKIRYRFKAKSRHGVHSPFVYDFIENILLRRPAVAHLQPVINVKLNDRQQYLLSAIAERYQVRELVSGIERAILNDKGAGSLYILMNNEARQKQFSEHDIVLIPDIHADRKRADEWTSLYKKGFVPLSIDVFEMGILFFKKDFKLKQHFILKYR